MSVLVVGQRVQELDEDLDWSLDWNDGPWLESGDTVASSTWTEATGDITLYSPSNTTTVTTVKVKKNADTVRGTTYTLVNTMTSAAGRVARRAIELTIL